MWRATINSWRGILAAARSDLAMRQELAVLAISIPLALFLTPDFGERLALVGSLLFIIIVELLNTAIEKLADRVTREQDPAIGRIKDMAQSGCGS
jgi:diacylglycerol kinase (ATP)